MYISTNKFDSFNPYQASADLARDWCAKGADVQLWTNEQPPFLNKASINTLLPYFVDGERSMQWVADRFNGVPTTPIAMRFRPKHEPDRTYPTGRKLAASAQAVGSQGQSLRDGVDLGPVQRHTEHAQLPGHSG